MVRVLLRAGHSRHGLVEEEQTRLPGRAASRSPAIASRRARACPPAGRPGRAGRPARAPRRSPRARAPGGAAQTTDVNALRPAARIMFSRMVCPEIPRVSGISGRRRGWRSRGSEAQQIHRALEEHPAGDRATWPVITSKSVVFPAPLGPMTSRTRSLPSTISRDCEGPGTPRRTRTGFDVEERAPGFTTAALRRRGGERSGTAVAVAAGAEGQAAPETREARREQQDDAHEQAAQDDGPQRRVARCEHGCGASSPRPRRAGLPTGCRALRTRPRSRPPARAARRSGLGVMIPTWGA